MDDKNDNSKGCLTVGIAKMSKGIASVMAGVVCGVFSKTKYVKVEPDYVFLWKGNDYQSNVNVLANVKWKVED